MLCLDARLPDRVVGLADAETPRRELQDWWLRTVAFENSPGCRQGKSVQRSPLADCKDTITVIARRFLGALPATLCSFAAVAAFFVFLGGHETLLISRERLPINMNVFDCRVERSRKRAVGLE